MIWGEDQGKLCKEFIFKDFMQAVVFVNAVAEIAERQGHHPDVLIHGYNKCRIMLFTHDAEKITAKDHLLADEIDKMHRTFLS